MTQANVSSSTPEVRAWGVVPAAGIGSRMGALVPKQYMGLAGSTVIEHTLVALLADDVLSALVVALSPEDQHFATLDGMITARVEVTTGGATRAASVAAGIHALAGRASDDDWVVVHDAARPCLQPGQLAQMLEQLAQHPVGGILALPMADTVKQADDAGNISATIPRANLWRAQTPQVFRYGLLRDALADALDSGHDITDEAMALELRGMRPHLIIGSVENIKITYPQDLALAAGYLKQRRCSE